MRIARAAVVAGVTWVAVLGATVHAVAWAGGFHVYACRTPDGEVAPVDGWSESTSQVDDEATNSCSGTGGLIAALKSGSSHPADTDLATWAFNAPIGETISAASLWRAGDTAGGGDAHAEASYMFWFAGFANSGGTAQPFDMCEALSGCTGEGNLESPFAASNHLEAPTKALHSAYLSLNASCGSLISSSVCPASAGDPNGNAAIVELFAADLTLTQETAPTVKEVSGTLATAATVSGTSDVGFTATDPASGVY
jgi:hypothetical protein